MQLNPNRFLTQYLLLAAIILIMEIFINISFVSAQSINQLFKERIGNQNSQPDEPQQKSQPAKPAPAISKPLSPEEQKRKAVEAAEAKRIKEEAAAAAKAQREMDAQRQAQESVEKQRQRDEAAAILRAQREVEAQRQAQDAAERQRIKEEAAAIAKAQREAEAQRQAQEAVERQRQKDEAANAARAQKELERRAVPLVVAPIDTNETLLSAFDGTWVSIFPPGPVVNFFKVSFGSRQVSLPNLGHATVVISDGNFGSNFKVSGVGFNCFYMVLFTAGYGKMVWDFKGGDSLCYSSAVFERMAAQR